ncbi:MAG: DUF4231 domain-containing protein [Lachnospiraceae bacterium]|nr:DUF4231 domain-containing protein [Lachnospiraceae bacterium]
MYYNKEITHFFNELAYNLPPQVVCQKRTLYCLNWYTKKAIFYKKLFFILSIINISAPIISGLLLNYSKMELPSAILSALTSFSASLLALCNVRDKWTNYRTAAEYIKKEYTLYMAKIKPYNTENCHAIYLTSIEGYMESIHSHWYNAQISGKQDNT